MSRNTGTLPMPTILTTANLYIRELHDIDRVDPVNFEEGKPPTEIPFDLLWLEFTEADGSTAPLPTGWDAWFVLLGSSGFVWPGAIIGALRHAWTPRKPPPEGRWHAFVYRLTEDITTSMSVGSEYRESRPDRGLPAMRPIEREEKRAQLQTELHRQRAKQRAAREAHMKRTMEAAKNKRDARARQVAAVTAKMRQHGTFVRRRRLPEETPAPVHIYYCGALAGTPNVDLFEGFDALPEGARTCRTCRPQDYQEHAA